MVESWGFAARLWNAIMRKCPQFYWPASVTKVSLAEFTSLLWSSKQTAYLSHQKLVTYGFLVELLKSYKSDLLLVLHICVFVLTVVSSVMFGSMRGFIKTHKSFMWMWFRIPNICGVAHCLLILNRTGKCISSQSKSLESTGGILPEHLAHIREE